MNGKFHKPIIIRKRLKHMCSLLSPKMFTADCNIPTHVYIINNNNNVK